jgi:predicted acyltransferase
MSTSRDLRKGAEGRERSSLDPLENRAVRLASIDIFRGLTMMVMIFVNDLSSVKGLPWWTYHMPAEANFMTYVDMVFPAFLFIVGMSIPLAIRRRLSKGDTPLRLWGHVIARSLSLVILGLALANADKVDRKFTGVNESVWGGLFLTGAILFWNIYPSPSKHQAIFKALKWLGFILMAAMFVIFRRRTEDGQAAWLDISYWEILGLIGWTYLAVCILYIPTRKWRWAPPAWLVALLGLNIISSAHWIRFSEDLPFYLWPFNTGAFGLIVMAGVVTSAIMLSAEFSITPRQRSLCAAAFAVVLLIAGYFLTPLGISKIRATPTWCLYSAGSSVLIFLLLYWICDVRKKTGWAAIVWPAGANTLLTYLLPDLYYFALGEIAILDEWHSGWPGVAKSIIFTLVILGISSVLTRWKLRMQL